MILLENKCKHCNSKINMSEKEYLYYSKKALKLPKHCKACLDKRNREGYGFICERCGKSFVLDGLELEKYIKLHGKEPCKCERCR